MYGSAMGNGNVHDQSKIPILLAGRAAGRVHGGRHIANPDPTPLANLMRAWAAWLASTWGTSSTARAVSNFEIAG